MPISSRLLEQDRVARLVKTSGKIATLNTLTVNTDLVGLGGLDTSSFPEMIVNGTFTTDLSSWTTAGVTWVAGVAHMVASGGRRLEQSITTEIGRTYTVSLSYNNTTNPTGDGAFMATYTAANATGTLMGQANSGVGTGPGTLTFNFVALTTTTFLFISAGDTNDVIDFDNVSIKTTGSSAAFSTFYYVYAVSNGTTPGLVASTSAIAPAGFTNYRKVGAFYTDPLGVLFKTYYYGEINILSAVVKIAANGTVLSESADIINGNFGVSGTATYVGTFNTGIYSIAPVSTVSSELTNALAPTRIVTASIAEGYPSTTQVIFYVVLSNSSSPVSGSLAAISYLTCGKAGVDATQPDWTR